jgi:hypothetical protein
MLLHGYLADLLDRFKLIIFIKFKLNQFVKSDGALNDDVKLLGDHPPMPGYETLDS